MKQDDFEIGGRYRNEKGRYEVLNITGNGMRIRYDSGAEADLDRSIQAKIISRLEREEMSAIPPNTATGKEEDVAWTLGALAKHGNLEAHVPPQSAKGFLSSYRRQWPDAPEDLPGYYPIADAGSKWGAQLRISFPDKLENNPRFTLPADIQTVAAPDPHTRRINRNGLWWHLVEQLGFKLGNEQNVDEICNKLPEHVRSAFLDGAKSTV